MTGHDRFLELAATSVDFPLSAEEERELADHLAGCPACAREAAGFRHDARRLHEFGERSAPPRLREDVWAAAVGRPRRRASRPILLVAAAVLLIGAFVAQSLSTGSRNTQLPGDGSPEAPVASATPSLSPSKAPAAATAEPSPVASAPLTSIRPSPGGAFGTGLTWQASTTSIPGSSGARMNGIAWFRSRFVAVGEASGAGAVWTSTDGLTWSGQVLPNASPLLRIAAASAVLVAVGGDQVWVSEDADAWSMAGHPPAAGAVLVGVSSGPGGFAAVGRTGLTSTKAAVWTSTDGRTWTRTAGQPAFDGFCPSGVAWGVGGLVAVGDDCAAPGKAVVVSSTDGVEWRRQSGEPFEGSIEAVIVSDRRYVASGALHASGPGQAIYTSDDGMTWTRRHVFASPDFGEGIVAITRFGSGYIAVGVRQDGGTIPATWVSRDGLSWSRGDLLPIPENSRNNRLTVTGVAFAGDRVTVVGISDNGGGDAAATTWAADLP